jgi:hypothetical protein
MAKQRMVIYQDEFYWNGAVEFTQGRWPFKKVQHAPVTHANSAQEVFAWLLERYPDYVIALDPDVSLRYGKEGDL